MLRLLSALALGSLALGLAACGGSKPEASFTATPTLGEAPFVVEFTDASTEEPTGWLWRFGDGETSTEQNPSHEYAEAGIYTVSLTATNGEGSDDVIEDDLITVEPPPNPVCADLLELRETFGRLAELDLGSGALAEFQGIVIELGTKLASLRASAAGEYAEEIDQLQSAYDAVLVAAEALASDDLAAAIPEVAVAVGRLVSAFGALETILSTDCP